jgi:hypothetical protein
VAVIYFVAKPGETAPMQLRLMRVVHLVSGGTFERKYADGKEEVIRSKQASLKFSIFLNPMHLKTSARRPFMRL